MLSIVRFTSDLPVPVEPTMAIRGCLGGILLKRLNLCHARDMKSPCTGRKVARKRECWMTCDRKIHKSRPDRTPQALLTTFRTVIEAIAMHQH
jgi:hypothetical protein